MRILLLASLLYVALGDHTLDVTMPGVPVTEDDTYMHTSYQLQGAVYVTGFECLDPHKVVHHMLVYGCEGPAEDTSYWQNGGACAGDTLILWAWANKAPPFIVPQGVSFTLGDRYKYIVVQLHYKDKQSAQYRDRSGVRVTYTTLPTLRTAGVMIAVPGAAFSIPPNTARVLVPLGCAYTGPDITVFAYRTHAHDLGRQIIGYRTRGNSTVVIGDRDPRLPQQFVQIAPLDLTDGDNIHGSCVYSSVGHDTVTHEGSTHHDEMCNFYMMYYREGGVEEVPESC